MNGCWGDWKSVIGYVAVGICTFGAVGKPMGGCGSLNLSKISSKQSFFFSGYCWNCWKSLGFCSWNREDAYLASVRGVDEVSANKSGI